MAGTITSTAFAIRADGFARDAELRERDATSARDASHRNADEANQARAAAQAETYSAVLSEVRALRAGHQPGWREKALGDLARLGVAVGAAFGLDTMRTLFLGLCVAITALPVSVRTLMDMNLLRTDVGQRISQQPHGHGPLDRHLGERVGVLH